MKAYTLTLQKALQGDRRFVIPVYQRPYVWELERQWEPLWTDIETTALRLADVRTAGHEQDIPKAEADKAAPPHFLGAIVLEQHPTGTGEVDVRWVVDGQQRLATLQLVIRGALDALTEIALPAPSLAKLRKLILNDEEVVGGDALHKVWPRPAEQTEYLEAMATTPPAEITSGFSAARQYFAQAVRDFLADDETPEDPYEEGTPNQKRASLLVATLLGLVKLVVIDLDDVDDAQVIFEALNARNTPLSATDLVKNLLFMRALKERSDPQDLYERVWARFDKDEDWWRAPIGVGHAQRPRQDWLVGDWLIAELGRVINVGRLYGEFRRWLDTNSVGALDAFHTLNHYADGYEVLTGRQPGASEAELLAFDRIEKLNIAVANPVLLWLLVQPEYKLGRDERELAILAIESFVIRRMATKWQTRAYGQAFVEVLEAARGATERPGLAIIDALRAGPHGYAWPTDADVSEQFRTSRYYGPGGISQGRLRMILSAIDQRLQAERHKAEPMTIKYEKLQIEHLIPQEWATAWPIEAETDAERRLLGQERESHLHRIGNLTLVSDALNPALSNDPWLAKRKELREHSNLRLNALLCEMSEWSEETIVTRGNWLAEQLAAIWPGPDSDSWDC